MTEDGWCQHCGAGAIECMRTICQQCLDKGRGLIL